MKTLRSSAVVAGIIAVALASQPAMAKSKKQREAEAAAAAAAAAPAASPAAGGGPLVQGIGIASLDAALVNSDAFRAAASQRPTTYKAQYDNATARGKALESQLNAMITKFNTDRAAPKANQAALQQQARTIQEAEANGKQEIQKILMPIALSEAYVTEQIEDKMNEAVQRAMTKKRVNLLLQPGAVVARSNGYDITSDIVTELNALIPAAQLAPPAGWEPREVREARAAQAAQQQGAARPAGAAPAATPAQPAGPQPDGR